LWKQCPVHGTYGLVLRLSIRCCVDKDMGVGGDGDIAKVGQCLEGNVLICEHLPHVGNTVLSSLGSHGRGALLVQGGTGGGFFLLRQAQE